MHISCKWFSLRVVWIFFGGLYQHPSQSAPCSPSTYPLLPLPIYFFIIFSPSILSSTCPIILLITGSYNSETFMISDHHSCSQNFIHSPTTLCWIFTAISLCSLFKVQFYINVDKFNYLDMHLSAQIIAKVWLSIFSLVWRMTWLILNPMAPLHISCKWFFLGIVWIFFSGLHHHHSQSAPCS